MGNHTPIFFYIVVIAGSIWGPITIVSRILYPERVQKQILEHAKKGLGKFNPFLPQIRKKEYVKELRTAAAFGGLLFFAIMIILLLFVARDLFYKLIAILQIASFVGAFLFAKIFPDKFFGKYK